LCPIQDTDFIRKGEAIMDKGLSFLGGFIVGAVAGAAVAAFMTPQPGDDLQRLIRERLELMAQEGRRAAAERRAELEAQFAQARQFQKPAARPAL
jgi:gas vesicle protein